MSETKTMIVYCGHYRKPLLHPLDFESSSNECSFESRVKVSKFDWEEDDVNIDCPVCGSNLHQQNDHFIEDDGRRYMVDTVIDLTICNDATESTQAKPEAEGGSS